MKINMLFVISLALTFNLAYSQSNNSAKDIKLSDFGLHNYPTFDELNENILNEKYLTTSSISFRDINDNFSNITDLEWLKEITKENKVFLIGEDHYHRFIMNLRNRLLFALNTYDYYPLLIMEAQYSNTPFVNHYLNIIDDVRAENYFKTVIYDMITSYEEYKLLQHIRRWNKLNPNKKIQIGYSDIEHDYKTTIKNILIPYFKKIKSDLYIDVDNLSNSDLGELILKFRNLLKIAQQKDLIGDFPFITTKYINNVIENINSTYKAYYYQFDYYRQKAIVRNIIDPAFLGDYIIKNKILIHAGGYHTPTHFPYPDNGNFYREGSYLTYDFKLTKANTYSVRIYGLARSLNQMAEVDLDSCLHQGWYYRRIVNNLNKVFKKGLISEKDNVLENKVNAFEKLIIKKAIQNDNNPIIIDNIQWDEYLNISLKENQKLYQRLKDYKDKFERYDKIIFVPQSPLIIAQKKK